jgi:uncharacterized membrane protein
MPSVRLILTKNKDEARRSEAGSLMRTIQKRLRPLVIISIVGLILTGVYLSKNIEAFDGLLSFSNIYSSVLSIKHIFVLLMIIVSVFRMRWMDIQGRRETAQKKEKPGLVLLFVNLVLGLGVLLLSALGAALTQ